MKVSATAPLGATSKVALASVPSYAGVLWRLFTRSSSFAAGSWLKHSENYLRQGQRFGKNLRRSFIVNSLVELGVADDIECLQP